MSQEESKDLFNVLSSLIESQTNGEDDIRIFEELLFSNRERTFNALDQESTYSVLKAINQFPSPPKKFQCSHCEELFSKEDFQSHICLFDENHVLIPMEMLPEPETHLQEMHRLSTELIMKNQSMLKSFNLKNFKAQSSSSNFECFKCFRKFVRESRLRHHLDYHIGDLINPSPPENSDCKLVTLCNICHEIFGVESDAWDHYLLKRHDEVVGNRDGEGSHEDSPTCFSDKKLKSSSQVPCTLRSVNVSKLFQCEFCDLIFFSSLYMFKHVSATHDPANAFECNKCELKNLSLKEILLHRRDECLVFRDLLNPLKDFPRVWVCNVCQDEFRGLEQLLDHRHTEHHFYPRVSARKNELLFLCERCVTHFKTAPELVNHFSDKHLKTPTPGSVGLTSQRIPETATTRRGGVHQTSTRPRLFLCEVCGKSFTQSSHLWQHLRFHQGVKPFQCPFNDCDRRFTIKPDLNDHVRKIHTGERPFMCLLCGKRFLTGSVYYQHRLIHLGERRYGCEECGRRFYRADALKNHMRIHSGEKPYVCSVCFRGFRQRGDREKHFKTRHPNEVAKFSPRKQRIKSFGRGHIRNNTSLYSA